LTPLLRSCGALLGEMTCGSTAGYRTPLFRSESLIDHHPTVHPIMTVKLSLCHVFCVLRILLFFGVLKSTLDKKTIVQGMCTVLCHEPGTFESVGFHPG
jgi:hypothetical protein